MSEYIMGVLTPDLDSQEELLSLKTGNDLLADTYFFCCVWKMEVPFLYVTKEIGDSYKGNYRK